VRLSVCLDVNQGIMKRNRCTQRLVVLQTDKSTNEPCMQNKKEVTLTYFTEFLGHRRKYLYVYYLCKLLTYSHQICIEGTMHQLTDSPLVWPTFQGHRGQNVKIKLWANQGGPNRNHCTQRLVILLTNPNRTPKLGQSDLLYRSQSPAEKNGRE